MARPSDREFQLKRKIKELEEQCRNKDSEIQTLKKRLEKAEKVEDYKPKKPVKTQSTCPDCEAELKVSQLPFGQLILCSKGCGYRETRKDA